MQQSGQGTTRTVSKIAIVIKEFRYQSLTHLSGRHFKGERRI